MAGALAVVLLSMGGLTFPAVTTTAALLVALPVATGGTSLTVAFEVDRFAIFGLGTTESVDFLVGI
jgi:hypothetical protein